MPMTGFRPRLIVLLAAAAGYPAAAVEAQKAPAEAPTITTQLEKWFKAASRSAPGDWGIAVANQDGYLVWGVQPTRALIPASTVKLFTTGFARSVLGADARQQTRVVGVGHVDPVSGSWIGTWSLELNGDPTLERPGRGGPTLSELAQQLHGHGIRQLVGPLSVSSASVSGLASASYPSVWHNRHKGRSFAPLIGELTLNENVLRFSIAPAKKIGAKPVLVGEAPSGVGELVTIKAKTVQGRRSRLVYRAVTGGRYVVTGTIGVRARTRTFASTVADPRILLEAAWARALSQAGIEWQRASGLSAPSADTRKIVLAEVSSQPFDSIASEVNRRSLNIGAELMLRWAGGPDPRTAAERLTAHVQQITGDFTSVRLVDGSGLSSEDRASPMTFVSYLARFPLSPGGRNFPQLLPPNGTGTLRKLANGLPTPGVVRAKTGTLGNAATLAGYLGHQDGVLLVSLMYNGSRVYTARQHQWKLFRMLGAQGVVIPGDSIAVVEALGGDPLEPPDSIPIPSFPPIER
jgi:D-alanyl-D-alanine carboxypeptidase/D-alanyl-D-alanine-endopeptidase (penicillin-binding protein 4)